MQTRRMFSGSVLTMLVAELNAWTGWIETTVNNVGPWREGLLVLQLHRLE